MILPRFEYRKAKSIEEALSLYNHYQGKALYLAGGTDLIPRIKLRLEKPLAVIDLKPIEELKKIREDSQSLKIGPLLSIFELCQNKTIKSMFPALWEAGDKTSCETLQMRGTVGGNLLQDTRCLFYNKSEFWRRAKGFCLKMKGEKCHVTMGKSCFANHMSDLAPALISLKAEIKLFGLEGERRIGLEELYTGKGERPVDLKDGEILTEILIPKSENKGGYEKFRLRGAIDYPLVGVAFSTFEGKGRLSISALGPKPHFKEFRIDEKERAIEEIYREVHPVANTILDPTYRKEMVVILAKRLVERVLREKED